MTPTPSPVPPRYRHLDGIRGFAIALVVVFHVFVGKVSSGVDVFLFVGGLLLLSSQLRAAGDPQGRTFRQGLVRILRRLLPALITVIAATVAGVVVLFSRYEWESLLADASASLTYWVNWRLIATEADYDAAGSGTTPFQHLWSMSVQLQIYLAIIALVFLTRWILNRGYERELFWRRSVTVVLAVLTAASFAYATHLNASGQQPVNYYSTLSRFWEIGVGALAGLFVFSLRPSRRLASALAWTGLVLVLSVGLLFDGADQFPGPLALVPLMGALCLVIAGLGDGRNRPLLVRWLEAPWASGLGNLAYSLYLWHWPILILGIEATGLEAKNPVLGVPVIALSLALARLTHMYVETPLRQKSAPRPHGGVSGASEPLRPRRRFAAAASLATVFVLVTASPPVLAAATALQQQRDDDRVQDALANGGPDTYPGAAELLDGVVPRDGVPVYPVLADRDPMMPATTRDGCTTDRDGTEIRFRAADGSECVYGDETSDRTLYVVGGSHSEHWLGALEEIGEARGIRIIPLLRAGCPLYKSGQADPGCFAWSEKVEDHILAHPPTEGVFMVSTRPAGSDIPVPEYVPDEYEAVFTRIATAGIPVFAMRDNPWLRDEDGEQLDPRVCLTEDPSRQSCTMPAVHALAPQNPAEAVLADDRIVHLDLSDLLVKDAEVHAVIGNMLVYRDWNHFTDQYVRTLTPELERQMFGEAT